MLTGWMLPPPGFVGSSGNCWFGSSAMSNFQLRAGSPLACRLPNLRVIDAHEGRDLLCWRTQRRCCRSLSFPCGLLVNHCDFGRLFDSISTSNYNTADTLLDHAKPCIFSQLHEVRSGVWTPGLSSLRGSAGFITPIVIEDGKIAYGSIEATLAAGGGFWSGVPFGCKSELFFCAGGGTAGTLNSIPRSSFALTVAGTSRSAREIFWVRSSKT